MVIDAIQARYAVGKDSVPKEVKESREWWREIEPMIERAEKGKVEILISEIVVAESWHVRGLSDMGVTTNAAIDLLGQWFNQGYIVRSPVTQFEAALAAKLQREHTLATCDALIAATAALHGASKLYTRDGCQQSEKRRRTKHGKLLSIDNKVPVTGNPGGMLRIMEPNAANFENADLFKKHE